MFARLGLDGLIVRRFDRHLAETGAEAFVHQLLAREIGLRGVVIGHDFRFGRGREGTPDMLAAVARLAGMDVGSPRAWRILDLGCSDGGNLLSIAAANPEMRCVGVDGNLGAIQRGRALAEVAGLDVELVHGDITALPESLGTFDAVLVHGVWSWGGDGVRAALPGALDRLLSADGLAYISYLAHPS